MPKNTNKTRMSQLIAKTELKKQSLNQIRHYLIEHVQIWNHFFDQKKLKYFNDFQNRNFTVL